MVTLTLSPEEFTLLQKNVKDKLIVGKDLFQKTSPQELKRFYDFVQNYAPFDIVFDALNVCYATKTDNKKERIKFLNFVADYFLAKNKKILILGRKHIMSWSPQIMSNILKKTNCFFTEDM